MIEFRDFRTLLVHVYAFNYKEAASDLGVTTKTIHRWYENNKAPTHVVKYLMIVARGYLPDREPYIRWYIKGDYIHTPYGRFLAAELEFLNHYKWSARRYADIARNRRERMPDIEKRLKGLIDEASSMLSMIRNSKVG
ncbi:hypothetical protein BFR57_08925 [Idiomarina sp. MD25a]|uniref:hypothetical protein n=1 Tax=Idiomarina sp. MD25a TaxID=1889913 RepID=UPI0008F89073|nr:hypothetical protein [Idiomarina sp. MD25a]OIN02159.1 hypothetical protein BFR57_08925 [Idiomarina sp. MD25a]